MYSCKVHKPDFFTEQRVCTHYHPLRVMADGHTEMGNNLSSDEEEARHQAFKNTRIREFYKQGFEAGLEVASEEVIRVDSVKLLIVSFKVSLPATQRTQALALYKEGYEVGQRIYRRKVGYTHIGCVALLYLSRSLSMTPQGTGRVVASPSVSYRYLVCIVSLLF